jgi:hypothetical protein
MFDSLVSHTKIALKLSDTIDDYCTNNINTLQSLHHDSAGFMIYHKPFQNSTIQVGFDMLNYFGLIGPGGYGYCKQDILINVSIPLSYFML